MMRKIVSVHFTDINDKLAEYAIDAFYRLRLIDGIEKRPATRELINWIRALRSDPDFNPQRLARNDLPFLGVLFKKSRDFQAAADWVNSR